jgi:hypothetical protein
VYNLHYVIVNNTIRNMEPKIAKLREKVSNLEKEFQDAKQQLTEYVGACQHHFGEIIYDPIYHEAFTIPGDAPGTMGSDWQGPVHVPAETIDRWRRECKICGLVQYTERTSEEVTKKPKW